MDTKQIDRLIECLESARSRPAMYFGGIDVEAAMHFLNGAGLAVMCLIGEYRESRDQVITARGWQLSAMHPSREMTERGMTPDLVIVEMLAIEIETLRRCERG